MLGKRPFAAFLAAVITMQLTIPGALAAGFVDVHGNWAEKYVNALTKQGIISVPKDGKFLPDDPITRAVFSAWFVKIIGLDKQPVPSKPSFPDVKPTDWFYKPVEIIRQNNYVSGYADGFRPQQFIQKGEVVTIISRALGGPQPEDSVISEQLAKYKDADKIPDWARLGIAEASQASILANHPDANVVSATSLATRADTAALLYNLNQYLNNGASSDTAHQTPSVQPATSGAAAATPTQPLQPAMTPTPAANPPYSETPPSALPSAPAQPTGAYVPPMPYNAQPSPAYPPEVPPSIAPMQPPSTSMTVPPGAESPVGTFLQGGVTVVGAGTHIRASLNNQLDSSYSHEGEEFEATVTEPVMLNGQEAVPAGSKLIGQITKVVPAHAGHNGKIDVKFTNIETPDGRKYPISASIDVKQLQAAAGVQSGASRALHSTEKGAIRGALIGGGAGALMSMASRRPSLGRTVRGAAKGAVAGTVVGAGVGLAASGIKKGQEITVPIGTVLPVQLDQALSMGTTPASPPPSPGGYAPPSGYMPPAYGAPPQQPYYAPQQSQPYPQQVRQPYGGYQPPPQQPYGGYQPPQQQPYPNAYPQPGGQPGR